MIQLIGKLSYQTNGSAGADLYSAHDIIIPARQVKLVSTAVFIKDPHPSNMYLDLRIRSSLPKKGLMLANGAGVIDSDYPGEILVPLYNFTDADVQINKDDRIAQIILANYYKLDIETKDNTRTGGFGSTGN